MNLFQRSTGAPKANRFHPEIETLEDRLALSQYLPILHSNYGAPNTLYLDFDGIPEAHGNLIAPGGQPLPAFDLDGDPNSFTDQEKEMIRDVHKRVAEDFAPFNINVTTVDPSPGVFTARQNTRETRIWRVSMSGDPNIDLGINSTDVGGSDVIHGYAGSAWESLMGTTRLAAELATVASHEAGHNMGLSHKPDFDSSGNWLNNTAYGVGTAEWTAIMGDTNEPDRTIWNASRNVHGQWQDDITHLGALLGYRADDYSSSASQASYLGNLTSGTTLERQGLIGANYDRDYFRVFHPGGMLHAEVDVLDSVFAAHGVAANLDSSLQIRDSTGRYMLAWSSPSDSLDASLDTNLERGWYVVQVSGVGRAMGQYTLRVNAEKRVNSTSRHEQSEAVTATAANGMSVVVWTDVYSYKTVSYGIDSETTPRDTDIRAQMFDPSGRRYGSEIIVAYSTRKEYAPAVAMDDAGNFTVVWTEDASSTNSNVKGAQFSWSGRKLRTFSVATDQRKEYDPSIGMAGTGQFVVSYTFDYSATDQDIHAAMFTSFATRWKTIWVAYNGSDEIHSSVAHSDNGQFVVAYEKNYGYDSDILVAGYSSNGSQKFHKKVNGYNHFSKHPSAAMDDNGNIVVAYNTRDNSGNYVRAVRINNMGNVGPDIYIASYTNPYTGPAVAMHPTNDSFVVAHTDRYNRFYVREVSFENQVRTAMQIKSGRVYAPSISMDDDGDYLVAYTTYFDGFDSKEIGAMRGHL